MVAPAGAAYVQFRLCLYQLSYASGAPHWDDCSLNQVSGYQPDVISAITPSAGVFLTNTSFSFNVLTPNAGITTPTNSIKVVVNGVNESSSLVFSGNNTNWNVTLPGLVSNTIYNISISATNTAGLVTAAGSRFDTFSPNNFVVYSEDYDYQSGQFIQNPVPSTNAGPTSYWGLLGVSNIDYAINSGGGTYGGGNNQIVTAGLTIALGSIGPALGEGRAVATALSSLAQQPDAATTITRTLFVGLAMIESIAIYCFVVSMILLFANPFWNHVIAQTAGK